MAEPARVLEGGFDYREVVRRHLAECNNDREATVACATEEIMSDPTVARWVVREAVREGVDDMLREQYKTQRRSALRSGTRQAVENARAVVAEIRQRISDFPLFSGKALRDSVRSEVEASSAFYIASAKSGLERGVWLRMVAQRLPDDATRVGAVLDDQELQRLMETAKARVKKAAI